MLHQAEIKTRRNLILAARDPGGSIVSTGGVPASSVPGSHVPASSVPARSVPASNVPTGGVLAEPSSMAKAFEDPDWVAAMQEEMQQFYNQKGIVVRNKAKLVAQGHRQREGIDYDDVFALVARIEAIRL
nr:putative ribonuclease H-like domain-containing protein [Tanacetum cinerariifolium]